MYILLMLYWIVARLGCCQVQVHEAYTIDTTLTDLRNKLPSDQRQRLAWYNGNLANRGHRALAIPQIRDLKDKESPGVSA